MKLDDQEVAGSLKPRNTISRDYDFWNLFRTAWTFDSILKKNKSALKRIVELLMNVDEIYLEKGKMKQDLL